MIKRQVKNKKQETERVYHPDHYGGDKVYECIKVLEAWLTPEEMLGFCKGSAIKYLARAGKKEGADAGEDLLKSAWYSKYAEDFRERLEREETGEKRALLMLENLIDDGMDGRE